MSYIKPAKASSLLLALRPRPGSIFLVIGCNRLAASRVLSGLEGNYVVYITYDASSVVDPEISHRIRAGEITYLDCDNASLLDTISELKNLELVCVTDSLLSAATKSRVRSLDSCAEIADICQLRRIHLNVVDHTFLNDISFPATHRWRSPDNTGHALQIAVNTFGKGCRLATRIKREIVGLLPTEIGRAVDNISLIRSKIIELPLTIAKSSKDTQEDMSQSSAQLNISAEEEDDQVISEPLNTPVAQFGSPASANAYFPSVVTHNVEDADAIRVRRMKWVAQVSEYWPIKTIGRLQEQDINRILADFDNTTTPRAPTANPTPLASRTPSIANMSGLAKIHHNADFIGSDPISIDKPVVTSGNHARSEQLSSTPQTLHSLEISKPPKLRHSRPRVLLLGSGPGHPSLLTLAAFNALRSADLVLADKLVPSAILELIPASVETIIAKKFPGNAENAQIELQQLALKFLQERAESQRDGTVVRLKQGDPYIYGRGGEEVLFFREHGFETIIVPGISSAIAAPLLCNIPVTQRGVADSLILCTGVGRAGKTSVMPGFRRSRTLIVLMGVARIGELITALISDYEVLGTRREGDRYPGYLPIALIERGSSKDQRMLLSTLDHIEDSISRVGDQRPPGMLIIGWCCLALEGQGHVDVTEPSGIEAAVEGDLARVKSVLGDAQYLVRDGIRSDWIEFLDEMAQVK